MEKITGFLIVRKSIYEEIFFDHPFLEPFDGIFYHGIQRSQWEDVKEILRADKLPAILKEKYKAIKSSENDFTFIAVSQNFNEVCAFINVEDIKLKNEIIAITSKRLNEIKGTVQVPSSRVEWIGSDIILLGGWSLIRHGIFENKQQSLFEKINLNKYGLIDEDEKINDFLNLYNELATLDLVDPLIEDSTLGIEVVRIGKVIM